MAELKGIFDNAMSDYLKTNDKDSKYNRNVQGVYNFRIRKHAEQAIKDLTLLAEVSNEKQLEKIFTNSSMYPLFAALFKIEISAETNEDWVKNKNSKELKKKRQRLFQLSKTVLGVVGNGNFVNAVLPESSQHHIDILETTDRNLSEMLKTKAIE